MIEGSAPRKFWTLWKESKKNFKKMLFVLFSIDLYTCKSNDFDGRYSRTHAKEKPSKISNTAYAILLPYQKIKNIKNI